MEYEDIEFRTKVIITEARIRQPNGDIDIIKDQNAIVIYKYNSERTLLRSKGRNIYIKNSCFIKR